MIEAGHGKSWSGRVIETPQSSLTASERPYALNQAILACRPGGVVSIPGVFVGSQVPTALGQWWASYLEDRTNPCAALS